MRIGNYIPARNGNPAVIEREATEQGFVFKDDEIYNDPAMADEVCYVPETSDTAYTANDIIEICDNQKCIADEIFAWIDWQHPDTALDDLTRNCEVVQCKKCGRLFMPNYDISDYEDKCPRCGEMNEL